MCLLEKGVTVTGTEGIQIVDAQHHYAVLEVKKELKFKFDGHDYEWTAFIGERGYVEYWKRDGISIEGGDTDVEYQVLDMDMGALWEEITNRNCQHNRACECMTCGEVLYH